MPWLDIAYSRTDIARQGAYEAKRDAPGARGARKQTKRMIKLSIKMIGELKIVGIWSLQVSSLETHPVILPSLTSARPLPYPTLDTFSPSPLPSLTIPCPLSPHSLSSSFSPSFPSLLLNPSLSLSCHMGYSMGYENIGGGDGKRGRVRWKGPGRRKKSSALAPLSTQTAADGNERQRAGSVRRTHADALPHPIRDNLQPQSQGVSFMPNKSG